METEIAMRMSTHSRLLNDVLTHYKSTFVALKELITNSLQAKATKVEINLIPSDCDKDSIYYHPINSIEVKDNGHGVPLSLFQKNIMEVATDNKDGGLGIGRFGALQIGKKMRIETIGFDQNKHKHTKVSVTIDSDSIKKKNLQDIDFSVIFTDDETVKKETYYDVFITDLYHNEQESPKRNKLSPEFCTIKDFKQSIFESYPFYVFEGNVKFLINGSNLKKEEFCIGEPKYINRLITDSKGIEHNLNIFLYEVNLKEKDINIFFQVDNSGIKTSVARYQYSSPWHTHDAGAWYIFVESDMITRDAMSDFELANLGGDAQIISNTIRDAIDDFFKKSNIKYTSFVQKLKSDSSYPYKQIDTEKEVPLKVNVFNHTAYLLEIEQHLIENSNSARKTIYPMIKKVIEDGETEFLVNNIIELSDESRRKFCDLIEDTKLDDVIQFTTSVTKHIQFLDFLYELCYGDISKHIKERKQLHKIVEKQLWIFGEE